MTTLSMNLATPKGKGHGLYILGRIYTVMKDRRQRELLEPAYYSMIDKLLKIKQ
jgi:hypothetical protein